MREGRNIIITGFMGTGKTVVGQQLARQLGREFVDMDQRIEEEQGMSITEIFDRWGEDYFRQQENKLVKELSLKENMVIATGGGTLLSFENRELLGQTGKIICLYADSEVLCERLKGKSNRPLLKDKEVRREINRLLKERKKFYDGIELKVDTSYLEVQGVVDRIIKLLKEKE